MLAHEHWLGALGVLGFAKVVSVGVTAFLFDLTRPKLLQLAWFRRLYERVMAGVTWAHELIDPIKRRLKIAIRMLRPGGPVGRYGCSRESAGAHRPLALRPRHRAGSRQNKCTEWAPAGRSPGR